MIHGTDRANISKRGKNMNEPYKDWIVRYYASHDDIPPGHTDGELTELIRCKDCKYCDAMTIFGKTTLYSCTRKNPAVDVLPNDYCSRGRRKDESG